MDPNFLSFITDNIKQASGVSFPSQNPWGSSYRRHFSNSVVIRILRSQVAAGGNRYDLTIGSPDDITLAW